MSQTVGNYKIVGSLGVGGMGTVFRGEHVLIGRAVAVKLLNPEMTTNRDVVARFFNEARATSAIKHPGIVEIFDFGYTDNGHAFIVMELLEGEPLTHRIRARSRMSEAEATLLMRDVCSALAAAHAKGIVHRDLKPDNIFIVPDPELGERTKILDFGIAKLTDIGLASSATKTGSVLGTPTYMSPEQCRGSGTVDHRADLYSIGCMLYEMVAGRPPFINPGAGELIGSHLFVEPEALSRHAAVSQELEALVMSLLAKDPGRRVQTARELGNHLLAIAQATGVAVRMPAASMSFPTMSGSTSAQHPTPGHFTPGQFTPSQFTPSQFTPQHLTPGHPQPTPAPAQRAPHLTPAHQSAHPAQRAPSQTPAHPAHPAQRAPSLTPAHPAHPAQRAPSLTPVHPAHPAQRAPSLTPAHPAQRAPSQTPAHLTPAHLTPAHLTPAHLSPAHRTPADLEATHLTPGPGYHAAGPGAPTYAAEKPTTLSGTAGEAEARPTKKRRLGVVIAALVIVLGAGIGGFLAMQRGGSEGDGHAASAPKPTPPPPVDQPTATPPVDPTTGTPVAIGVDAGVETPVAVEVDAGVETPVIAVDASVEAPVADKPKPKPRPDKPKPRPDKPKPKPNGDLLETDI